MESAKKERELRQPHVVSSETQKPPQDRSPQLLPVRSAMVCGETSFKAAQGPQESTRVHPGLSEN